METSSSINIEDFMDVVYRCKFCTFTCGQSPDMRHHVRENHLQSQANTHISNSSSTSNIPKTSNSLMSLAVDAAVSAAVGTNSLSMRTVPASSNYDLSTAVNSSSSINNIRRGSYSIHVAEDVLNFNSENHSFMDKVSFTPGAVPVSQPNYVTLSNTSTPDLTELINLVKPADDSQTNSAAPHINSESVGQLTLDSVVQLQPQTDFSRSVVATASTELPDFSNSQPLTVMTIHVPNMGSDTENSTAGFVVDSSEVQDSLPVPDIADTKEFLLCGLCKLAFTTMDDCQAHMQAEHRELMQGTGVSIGVQVGGAKRGRKRKSEKPVKVVQESEDTEDFEWLPSVSENKTTHADGRVRRQVKPPKALKEDYVLGKRTSKRKYVTACNGYKIICPMMSCKARFKSERNLQVHLGCHNSDDSAFTCRECQTSFEFWKQLRIHLWKQHEIDVDLLTCEVCNYKTDTFHKMGIHKEIHTDEKPYTCNICHKGFRQASQMKNHQTIHASHEKREASGHWFASKTCDICERVFANSKCLKKHKEAVHSKFKPFKCSFCNHTTARKAMMELHLRTHTGEKPFKCDICPYSTGDHNSLRRHKMRHTGQKQYRCTLCPYTCIQSISLKQHMKHKHPGAAGGIFKCVRCPFRTINQTYYENHLQDHKNGLVTDKIIPPNDDSPKTRKLMQRSGVSSGKRGNAAQNLVEPLLMKHPQFHVVLAPGDESTAPSSMAVNTVTTPSSADSHTEVFNMQVTMLADGDTQVKAEDMARLSESLSMVASSTSPLQLIYATLSTISEQVDLSRVGEGRSSLMTVELMGGIHTAVLSSLQDGVMVHSITYHLHAAPDLVNGVSGTVGVEEKALLDKDVGTVMEIVRESEDSKEGVDISGGIKETVEKDLDSGLISLVRDSRDEVQDLKPNINAPSEIFFVGSGRENDKHNNLLVVEGMEGRTCTSTKETGSLLKQLMVGQPNQMRVLNSDGGEVRLISVDFLDETQGEPTGTEIASSVNEAEIL